MKSLWRSGCALAFAGIMFGALYAQRPFRVYPSVEGYDTMPLPPDWQRSAEWTFARLMYPHYARHNVPAYIIGPELGDGPMEHRPANILKVWPQRSAMECLRPDEFNPRIEELATQHCG